MYTKKYARDRLVPDDSAHMLTNKHHKKSPQNNQLMVHISPSILYVKMLKQYKDTPL